MSSLVALDPMPQSQLPVLSSMSGDGCFEHVVIELENATLFASSSGWRVRSGEQSELGLGGVEVEQLSAWRTQAADFLEGLQSALTLVGVSDSTPSMSFHTYIHRCTTSNALMPITLGKMDAEKTLLGRGQAVPRPSRHSCAGLLLTGIRVVGVDQPPPP